MSYRDALKINLKKYRHPLTKTELAKRVSMTQPQITMIEKGDAGVSLHNLEKLCDYFQCTPNDLLMNGESDGLG